MTVRIQPTKYTVCGLPEDSEDSIVWRIDIEYRSKGWWAVVHHAYCLSIDGEWDWEPSPSNRTDEFKAKHRFHLPDAIRHAEEAYPNLVINGLWVRNGKLVEADRG